MSILLENNFSDVEILTEETSGKKSWKIKGIYAQSEVVNKNRRRYPEHVLDESFNNYNSYYVQPGRAVGELSHPNGTQINLDRITHKINSVTKDGRNWLGEATILNTPCGNIVAGLLEGGVRIGVSTRANGKVLPNAQGINEVQSGLTMAAVDVVFNPSAPDAFVDGLMEGADFIWDSMHEDTMFLESLQTQIVKAPSINLVEAKVEAFSKFLSHIKNNR